MSAHKKGGVERRTKTAQSCNARNQQYLDGQALLRMKRDREKYIAATHPKIAGGQKEINAYLARNPVRNY